MDLQALLGQLQGAQQQQSGPAADTPQVDTAECVSLSTVAIIKILKHARAGVPMEVMGLMLGEFVDDFTVRCVDVFSMPLSSTGESVEAVDPVFQTRMLDALKQLRHNRLSSPTTAQQSFEQLNPRAVAVVVDPIQSVRGKVVIDAFRLISPQTRMQGIEPRQTTSNLGHLHKPSIQAVVRGLNRYYYSLPISYRKSEMEERMLLSLNERRWSEGLRVVSFQEHSKENVKGLEELRELAVAYDQDVQQEKQLTKDELVVKNVGRLNAKLHLQDDATTLMSRNIIHSLTAMLDSDVF